MKPRLRRLAVILLAAFVLLPMLPTEPNSTQADDLNDTVVRVLLSTDGADSVTVTLSGKYAVGDKSFSDGTVTATISDGTITLKHSSKGTVGSSKTSVRLSRVGTDDKTLLTFQNAKHGKRSYFGDFLFYNDGGTLRVVNYIDLQHYLYGVVSGEMSDSYKSEVLKVETIIAKGYVLAEVAARTSKYFDVYDTTKSQVYFGYIASETNTIASVDAVWTQTLLYQGRVVKTYYSTADGGQIITPYTCWGGKENRGAYHYGYDPFDLAGSSKNVVVTLDGASPKSMNAALYAFLLNKAGDDASEIISIDAIQGLYDPANPNGTDRFPKDLAPQKRYDWTLTVRTASGTGQVSFSCTPDEVKALVAKDATGTTCFVVRTGKTEWKLVWGVPSGHRAGLSHRGALRMVKEGYSYVDVLKFYYRGATLYAADGTAIESAATFDVTYEDGAEPSASATPTASASPTPTPSPTPSATAFPDPVYEKDVIITSNTLNLREGPSTAYTVIKKLKLGAILCVYGTKGDWLYVCDAAGTFGWVHGGYVTDYRATPTVQWEGVCNSDDSNLRTGPSTNFPKLYAIDAGNPLYVYYRTGNWYFVMDRNTGQGAFIYYTYVTLGAAAPAFISGDVDGSGEITAADAAMILRHIVNLITLRDAELLSADYTGDGTVNAADAAQILRKVVGLV